MNAVVFSLLFAGAAAFQSPFNSPRPSTAVKA
eukprot:CAMPEP_0197387186 /NCGR_PEP_ID=MMETSP1165-20131217/374_1 /TAXON_ID=284809 /ORGANISM="Chrysocystis fragilis, Strain CCMP3189" /LENGTH=31 /DNA_ID= /DNA_START= /DNA_END= /DNA_ORIENTATION=